MVSIPNKARFPEHGVRALYCLSLPLPVRTDAGCLFLIYALL